MGIRDEEIKVLKKASLLNASLSFTWTSATFLVYTNNKSQYPFKTDTRLLWPLLQLTHLLISTVQVLRID